MSSWPQRARVLNKTASNLVLDDANVRVLDFSTTDTSW